MSLKADSALGDVIANYPADSSADLAVSVFYELRRLGFDVCLHRVFTEMIIFGDGQDGDLEVMAVDVEWSLLRNMKW